MIGRVRPVPAHPQVSSIALVGGAGRAEPDSGVEDLAGVRSATAQAGLLEAVERPAVRGQGPRRRGPVSQPARGRGGALRGREVPDPSPGPDRPDPADASRHAGAGQSRLRTGRHLQPLCRLRHRHRQPWPDSATSRSSPTSTPGGSWAAGGAEQDHQFGDRRPGPALATRRRADAKVTACGLIHHSDAGPRQYRSEAFGEAAARLDIRQSLGKVGSCFDNALAESFNATLKVERVNRTAYPDKGTRPQGCGPLHRVPL